MSPPALEHEQT